MAWNISCIITFITNLISELFLIWKLSFPKTLWTKYVVESYRLWPQKYSSYIMCYVYFKSIFSDILWEKCFFLLFKRFSFLRKNLRRFYKWLEFQILRKKNSYKRLIFKIKKYSSEKKVWVNNWMSECLIKFFLPLFKSKKSLLSREKNV
jgi:hypothetical protein